MRVGVVDLGGNTARLLVAGLGPGGLERLVEERIVLGLGAEIERTGRLSKAKLSATANGVSGLHEQARAAGCRRVQVLVTSPGRQSANRSELERSLSRGSTKQVRFISPSEEARLAYAGALAYTPVSEDAVAVCDVGGGSTEIAIGSPSEAPTWCRSLDLGSLRITQRYLRHLPPTKRELAAARRAVREALGEIGPIPGAPARVLASGGTARSLRKLVGRSLGPSELEAALAIATSTTPRKLSRRYGVPAWRAGVLPGGALILAEIQALLGVPLEVADGGLREGAALTMLSHAAA
jgi:exopolyphosphatase/guanosine-5'-triphosphate,3'-diphosphate pyrophosphatase